PVTQNVAFTPCSRSRSSTWGVHVGSGPSSMVMLTPRSPASEACTMVLETRLTSPAPPGAAGADACGAEPAFTASACAVHTEAPTASAVTASAAPAILPYQPRTPPCRAMSVPPPLSFIAVDHLNP